jgi:probable HAF family extracellular repeat protein
MSLFRKFLTCLLGASSLVMADPQYQFVDLSLGGSIAGRAQALNENGQVVGYIDLYDGAGGTLAFSYQNGVMTSLGTLPGSLSSAAFDVNASGVVTGLARGSGNDDHGFLFADGVMSNLSTPDFRTLSGQGINDAGTIVGIWVGPSFRTRSFVRTEQGFRDIEETILFGIPSINNKGQIAYYESNSGQIVRLEPNLTSTTRFGTAGLLGAQEVSINNLGLVAGYGSDTSILRGALRAFVVSDGQSSVLEAPNVARDYRAHDLNDLGMVVGSEWGTSSADDALNAAIWIDGEFYNLNELTSGLDGFRMVAARDINNQGEIVGWGYSQDGFERPFMLIPVPEPGGGTLAMTALLLHLRRRKRCGLSTLKPI